MARKVDVEVWKTARTARWVTAIFVAAGFGLGSPAMATATSHRHHAMHHSNGTAAGASHTAIPLYKGALLEDADSGRVLYAYNADMQWPPASMAKMMLLLVASEQVNAGRVHMSDPVRISERSAHTGGSRLGLKEGDVYPLGELMKAALVKSANDAAVAVAEKIGGSVEVTVRMMNARARSLGMTHTEYQTVDGLPPRPTHDVDRTDAYDLATVARAIIRETNLLQWSSQEHVEFDNGVCILNNTNHLIGHFEGCDGLKTGFTFMAGFNVTTTAKRGDMRLVAVILGAPSNQQRFAQAGKLMQWGFDRYTAVALLRSGEPLPVVVRAQTGETITPIAARDVKVVLPKTDVSDVKVVYDVPPTISGPVRSGEPLGRVVVHDGTGVLTEVTAISPIDMGAPSEQLGASEAYGATAPPQQYNHSQVNQ
ncbi:MAG TPA: D-alanyl-D-alanine carboxypeptidase family protein [Candidatus Binataceae bacterium]|nr:D-alanyl-D-alanine carboxypeptidase family protein [Candidatus Binataceae bacterium]